ncbi:MAG TPA: hypothetical protein VKU19_06535 [Bryobacteraceae bacterium]|nr:hypothetical protein [Bryobacteraceae bacterium]
MSPEHKELVEPVRAYLLGKLDDQAATELELRYFTDRRVFLRIRDIETSLIQDYLSDHLSPGDRDRFESRYLRVPEMRQRLEEVRRLNEKRAAAMAFPRGLAALAAGVLLASAGGAWYLAKRREAPPPQVTRVIPALPPAPAVTLPLSPGLKMGGEARTRELKLPSPPALVRLILELPGQATPIDCTVQISKPDSDPPVIWTSPAPLRSTPATGGQVVTVDFESTILSTGDYIAHALGPDGQIRESYVFQAR